MQQDDNYDDYLDEYELEIQEDGAKHTATLVLCECGQEWTKLWDNTRLVAVDEWFDMLDNHFYATNNEHDAKMKVKLTDD